MKDPIKVIGIDPGLRLTGFGIIECLGQQTRYVASGVIKTSADHTLAQRLKVIFTNLTTLLEDHQPDEAAIEKVFVNVNPQSTLLLGQARGAALCGLVTAGLDIQEYTALQLKKAVVGYGHASKVQVQSMVQRLLHLDQAPGADAADALAVALCHVHTRFYKVRIS